MCGANRGGLSDPLRSSLRHYTSRFRCGVVADAAVAPSPAGLLPAEPSLASGLEAAAGEEAGVRIGVLWLGRAGAAATGSAGVGSAGAGSAGASSSALSPSSESWLRRFDFLAGFSGLGGLGGALIHRPPSLIAP